MEDRSQYLDALEAAGVSMDIRPFAIFIAERVEKGMGKKRVV
jgi:hypothetical protein